MLMAAHTHRACPCVAARYFDTGKVATVTAHENLSLTKSYLQSSSINLSDKNLGPSPILMLGAVLSTPSSAAVTSVDLSENDISGSTHTDKGFPDDKVTFDTDLSGFELLCKALSSAPITTIKMSDCDFGPKAISTLSTQVTWSTAAVESVDISGNEQMGAEAGAMLAKVMPDSNIKSFKFGKSAEISTEKCEATALDFSSQNFGPGEVIVISWWLSTPATAAVTSVDLSGNSLTGGNITLFCRTWG